MQETQSILKDVLLGVQFTAILIGLLYFFKLKNSYWKWFSVYLVLIFFQEYFLFGSESIAYQEKIKYAVFLGIPLQFIFLYWLYAYKSLKNKKMFLLSSLTYAIIIGFTVYFNTYNEAYSLSNNVGTIILIILLVLEFIKQIKNDDILKFRENKMFYINIGMVLFYVGNYPYHVFGQELYENHLKIFNLYNIYFLVTNCIMYLLFSASFIWGKTQS
ncbi:hypothetical protein [uncultured Lacinutrix sp.]|uniref:hypothetical protein n=1 Tax=uncultured Lacinutrix sp. TaxID=574032 RepID=UPI00262246C6|nr:hypothetical protein [uncultured Lacinutrix sp.]